VSDDQFSGANFSVILHSSAAPLALKIEVSPSIRAMPLPRLHSRSNHGPIHICRFQKFDSQSLLPERQILNSPVLFFQVPFTCSAVTSFWGRTPVATNKNVRATRIFFMFKSSTGSKPVRNKHDRIVPTMGILNMMPLRGKQFARGIGTKPGDPGPDTGSLSISVTDRRSRTIIGAKLKRSKRLTKRFPLGKQPPSGSNAQKAVEVMATGRFDAPISDIVLPGSSAYELMRQAIRRRPLKGIALSGLGMGEDMDRSRAVRFAYHLTKPINFQNLRSILEEISD
jgi:CheY-like chemotaxis protein